MLEAASSYNTYSISSFALIQELKPGKKSNVKEVSHGARQGIR